MTMTQVNQSSNFPIRVKYDDAEYEWGFRYEYEAGRHWEGYGYKSEKEALEGGIKYVKSMLLAKRRQAQEIIDDVNLRLENLNID